MTDKKLHDPQTAQTSSNNVCRVCIAKIAQTHGVKGLVKLFLYAENPDLVNAPALYTTKKGSETLTLSLKNPAGKYWLASVDGITNKEDAEELRGTELWLPREELPEIEDEDEFYHQDLLGLEVFNADNELIGTVKSLDNFGAGDLLEISYNDGKDFYLPFTKEAVPTINIIANRIEVVIPDGLLDEK